MTPKILLTAFVISSPLLAADDLPIADFEGQDYGAWKVEGTAFGPGPARGALPGQMAVEGFNGKGLVNSFFQGDNSKGVLTSPEFKIERRSLRFLIGGGGFAGKTCLNLLVDGKVVRTAVGPNTEPGGSEALAPESWDVAEFSGRTAQLQIVDDAIGSWGHINVDEIVLTDTMLPKSAAMTAREILLENQYLHFPVKTGEERGRKERVAVEVEGKIVREFDIELSEKPDWFAHLDVSAWQGKKATIRCARIAPGNRALALVKGSNQLWAERQIYQEPLRPQLHFSPRRGWNNDPNGMVFSQGEYHLYFQYNPYGWHWGNMHWGHAVSRDLVHWEELPIALYPQKYGDWVFSGSAIVDAQNTSGWKTGSDDLLVGAYTSTGRGECMVYSNDRGRTWQEYEGNPVVKHNGRDPRLLWHAPTRQWVMAIYREDDKAPEKKDRQSIVFYTSPNLKQWTYQSRIADFFECPDLFELPVDGDPARRKWVLTAASSEYVIGSFDGKTFTPETPKLPGHRGDNFYAALTFSHDPKGRTIQVGWLRAASPGMPFNQAMSLPLELSLKSTTDGPRLAWKPVAELQVLRGGSETIPAQMLAPGALNPFASFQAETMEVVIDFVPNLAATLQVTVRGIPIRYHCATGELTIGNHRAKPAVAAKEGAGPDGRQQLRFYVDRTCIEAFSNDGLTYVPVSVLPKPEARGLDVSVSGGEIQVHSVQAYELKSIWSRAHRPE